jgi:Protein of unknown function (DUF3108)
VSIAARRRWRVASLAVAVTLAHLWLTNGALPARLGEGAADGNAGGLPKRMDIAFVRELAPSLPPAPPAAAAPKPQRAAPRLASAASAPAPAASAADSSNSEPLPSVTPIPAVAALAASAPELAASSPDLLPVPTLTATVAEAVSPAASAAQEFLEWPPSTRLTYVLTGIAKGGPVDGQATVEWLRSGNRYQVFMEASVGPSFAPLITRRDSSEGDITAEGLSPRRYQQETKAVLQNPRRQTIFLDAERIRLPDGRELPRPAGVQDSVSQFVHLTWLFTAHPDWLVAGRSIEVPLALPRQVSTWIYDVTGAETQYTRNAGAVQTMHVKPRRESSTGGDLTVELWVAPSLQYLPVRIVIKQDAETYIDLLLERLPQQAAPANSR